MTEYSNSWGRRPTQRQKYPNTKDVQKALLECRKICLEAVETLRDQFLRDPKCPKRERLKAIQMILDRGLGKPVTQSEVAHEDSLDNLTPEDCIVALEQALDEQRALLKGEN
jgi:hypothetical protein